MRPGAAPLTPLGVQELLHEMQLHQIELEMQNEELRETQVKLDFEYATTSACSSWRR